MDIIIIFNLDKNISFFILKGNGLEHKKLKINEVNNQWKTTFSRYKLPNGEELTFVWKTFMDDEQIFEIIKLKDKKMTVLAKWTCRNGVILTHFIRLVGINVKYKIISKQFGNWANFERDNKRIVHKDDEGKWPEDPRNGVGYVC
jgi:hypothetical protein